MGVNKYTFYADFKMVQFTLAAEEQFQKTST
jgi:hypothetical protein